MTRLVTIPVSHFCEKARWALDLSGAPYREDGYPPVWHRIPLARLKATTAPALVCDDGTILRESSDIVRWADRAGDLELLGETDGERREIAELMARYDERVGPPARLLVYAHLLDEPRPFLQAVGTGLRPGQARALRLTRRPVVEAIRRFFRVNPLHIEQAKARLEAEVEAAGARLSASGYLVGDRFTAADLTFAALFAPAVFPPEYGADLPPLEDGPDAMRQDAMRWRATAMGAAVLDVYARHRRPPAADPAAAG